jgi:chaperone modulatory protein CbpM
MMRLATVIALFDDLSEAELSIWIARQWVEPAGEEGDWRFAEPHLARIRLIHDLHRTMAVPEDTLPLVLSLLDQLHTLRGTLAAVAEALADQPPEIQAIVRAALDRRQP